MKPATTPARTPLLTERQLAEWLSVSPHGLAHRRVNGSGPPYIMVGGLCRYDEAVVRDWLLKNTRTKGSSRKSRSLGGGDASSAKAPAPMARPDTTGGTGGPSANEKAPADDTCQGSTPVSRSRILKPSRESRQGLLA